MMKNMVLLKVKIFKFGVFFGIVKWKGWVLGGFERESVCVGEYRKNRKASRY